MAPKRVLPVAKKQGKAKAKSKSKQGAAAAATTAPNAPNAGGTNGNTGSSTSPPGNSKALAIQKKGQQSNMLTQLKQTSPNDPDYAHKMQLLQHYQNLPLRSSAKSELLKSWSKDKSCTWINTFIETNEFTETKIEGGFNGWGSKCLSCNIFLMLLCIFFILVAKEPGSSCQEPGSHKLHVKVRLTLIMMCRYLIPFVRVFLFEV